MTTACPCAGLRACQISQTAQMHIGLSEKELHNPPELRHTGGSGHPTHLTDRWAKRKHLSRGIPELSLRHRHLSPPVIFRLSSCPATPCQVGANVGACMASWLRLCPDKSPYGVLFRSSCTTTYCGQEGFHDGNEANKKMSTHMVCMTR